ncbi:MAG TPA: TIGR03986 family CRISPR-associated RAMP protein [Thermoanaerobaculia bacterium]|nr:TIGR03986 family CRISPR-associated RAMP protein [Thermoanaerobaculia bacterium]
MSWMKGTIEEFKGDPAKHAHHRKVKTEPNQPFEKMHYLEVEKALAAGYAEAELGQGKTIEFRGGPGAKGPVVVEVKPPERVVRTLGPAPAASDDEFHNPYHFLPLAPPPVGTLQPVAALLETNTFHDRFCADRFTGRLVCQVTTEGPMVIGGRQEKSPEGEKRETEVQPFTLPDPEKPGERRPAIPASTLRGLISNLFEAATGSAMRVLPEREFTRRADFQKDFLSEIGIVRRHNSALMLQPLTISTDEMTRLCASGKSINPHRARIVLNGYEHPKGAKQTTASAFLGAAAPRSASASNQQDFWYVRLDRVTPHEKRTRSRDGLGRLLACIGLDLPSGEAPIPHDVWTAKPEPERSLYTRGLLFIFGLNGSKAKNLPPEKKHEYFIPYSATQEAATSGFFPIPSAVLEDFERIARSAAALPRGGEDEDFPYVPAGRKPLDEEHGWRPEEGDVLYFKRDGTGRSIAHLSFSSIWRRSVEGSLHGAVKKVDAELVPFDEGRQQVTLAEQVFGFVEQRKETGEEGARALAGRVRFSHGLACSNSDTRAHGWCLFDAPRTLRILASPKPPSPSLYFGQHGHVSKMDLSLEKHFPAGRKVYLHHRDPKEPPAYCDQPEEAKRHLHLKANPVRPGVSFLFHIDFQNLTRPELALLCFALRPSEAFRHKLGLGKPLGLGTVEIEPAVLGLVDPTSRYSAIGLFGPKYAALDGMWCDDTLEPFLEARYRHERIDPAGLEEDDRFSKIAELLQEGRRWVRERAPSVAGTLEVIGDPRQVRAEVSYPLVAVQQGDSEHFQWFVANETLARTDRKYREKAGLLDPQCLQPIEVGKKLPTLKRLPDADELNKRIKKAKDELHNR